MVPQIGHIHQNILECIGNTPIIRLNKIIIEEGIQCEIIAKCEYFNAGGSVKDRIAKQMIESAEGDGSLKPGYTIIEPTSGNTGIGLALAGAVKGYKVIITMPEKMSNEKVNLLKALGAQVIRTPTEAASDSPESHISVAKRLNQQIKDSIILDQYSNPNNPLAHYLGTAEEIIRECGDHLDMVVIGAGTGGTVTGIAKRLKEKYPNIIVVGVDPIGSLLSNLSQKDELNIPYQIEGIGYDFIPKVLDRSLIDLWISTNDFDSFKMSRRLINKEGLLCGGSSGSATWAAIEAIKKFGFASNPSKRVLIILPDSVRNYMSKFLSSDWMFIHKFISIKDFQKEENFNHVTEIKSFELIPVPTIKLTDTINDVIKIIKTSDKFPVIESKKIIGIFDSTKLLQAILREGKEVAFSSKLKRFTNNDFMIFTPKTDHMEILSTLAANIPIYFTNFNGEAILSTEGLVQTLNPFNFK